MLQSLKWAASGTGFTFLMTTLGAADIKDCSQLLLDTACAWKRGTAEQKEALAKRYIALLSHLWEQGWAEGSSLGTTHHLGYAMRGLYPSVLLMRTVLESAGLMKKAADMLAWFSGRGRIFRREVRWESMDTLNTLLQGILYSILLEKVRRVQDPGHEMYQSWIREEARQEWIAHIRALQEILEAHR